MKNSQQEIFYDDTSHLDLKEAFFLIISSMKLIISLTIIFTLLGVFYSLSKEPQTESTTLIEIGQYDSLTEKNLLLEKPLDVIEDLKVVFIHKMFDRHSLKFTALENRLIRINVVKSTFEEGNEILNKISEYLINRHALLLDNISKEAVKELAFEITNLNNQIEFSNQVFLSNIESEKSKIIINIDRLLSNIESEKSKIISNIESEKSKIIINIDRLKDEITNLNNQIEFSNQVFLFKNNEKKIEISKIIERLNNEIPNIDLKIAALNSVITSDSNNLLLLKSSPSLHIQRTSQSPTLDQIIFNYTAELIDYENEKTNVIKEREYLQAELERLQNEELASEDVFKLSQEKNKLELQLKRLQNEELALADVFKSSQEIDYENEKTNVIKEREYLQAELERLQNEELASEDVFKLSQEKNKLEMDLKSLMDQNSTKTQLVGEIKSFKIGTRKVVIILLSFFAGLLLSVSIVFIRNALTILKD